jgi:hypothetical protein
MRGRILLPVSVLTLVLAFLAAGCGGGQSAEEKWATDVCTPINDWNTQIRQLINDAKSAVSSPDATSIDRLKTDAQKAVSATKKMKTDLQDLPPAPGANGQTARQNITSFANQVSATVDKLKTSVSNLSSSTSVTQAATVLSSAAGQTSTFTTQAKSAVNSAEQTSSKLKSGFEDADSCKDLRS